MSLGRIVTQWENIVGEKMAEQAQPVKIHIRKPKSKNAKPEATLEIAASSADCALLQMQKDLILQRINLIFGDQWVTDIRFSHVVGERKLPKSRRKKPQITTEDEILLEDMLEKIDDPDIKRRLNAMGRGVLGSEKRKD